MSVPDPVVIPDWHEAVRFGDQRPQPNVLADTELQRVVLGALRAGQSIPTHADRGGTFVFLEGTGTFHVAGQDLPAVPGLVVQLADDTPRGVDAETDLVFLAVRVA